MCLGLAPYLNTNQVSSILLFVCKLQVHSLSQLKTMWALLASLSMIMEWLCHKHVNILHLSFFFLSCCLWFVLEYSVQLHLVGTVMVDNMGGCRVWVTTRCPQTWIAQCLGVAEGIIWDLYFPYRFVTYLPKECCHTRLLKHTDISGNCCVETKCLNMYVLFGDKFVIPTTT